MLRVGARAGALRRRGPPGQGPRAGGDAALQESHRTGQLSPSLLICFRAVSAAFHWPIRLFMFIHG